MEEIKMKIYIISPADVATGGTELLQQLCQELNKNRKDVFMFYTEQYYGSEVEKRYIGYGNPICTEIEDDEENIIVVPETRVNEARKYRKSKIYFWWLSVDNYFGSRKRKNDIPHTIVYWIRDFCNRNLFNKSVHLVQSEYARIFLINDKGINSDNIQFLSDYLNRTYLDRVVSNTHEVRKNQILYNPKKGFEFTKLLMDEITEYQWIPLQNLTPDGMLDLMLHSKIYVDFGNHPGKDRIPRESVIAGCCVITGKRGSAGNKIDIPIKDIYKFEDKVENLTEIHELITACMKNFNARTEDFNEYRQSILEEEDIFKNCVARIFD